MIVITIGRSEENDIVIDDYKVSRIHLQIVQGDNGNCSVVDLNSANGTFVNGQRIRGEFYLQAGDTVIIGDTVLPWRSYLNQPSGAINIDVITKPEHKPKPKSKRTFWLISITALLILLLAGGGVYWKRNHDKKVTIEQKKKEIEEKEKKIEAEANEAEKKAMEAEIKTEEQARKEAQKETESEKKAKEEAQRAKEAEKKAKEVAQAEAAEKKRLAEENQKKKDKTEFDQLKIDAERLKGRGANPAEKIAEMKKIAEKYPTDPYFQTIIKNLEN